MGVRVSGLGDPVGREEVAKRVGGVASVIVQKLAGIGQPLRRFCPVLGSVRDGYVPLLVLALQDGAFEQDGRRLLSPERRNARHQTLNGRIVPLKQVEKITVGYRKQTCKPIALRKIFALGQKTVSGKSNFALMRGLTKIADNLHDYRTVSNKSFETI